MTPSPPKVWNHNSKVSECPIIIPELFSDKPEDGAKYIYEAYIGRGSYGTVWTVIRSDNPSKIYAVKVKELGNSMNNPILEETSKEISCLENAEHFACISLVETFHLGKYLFIVTDYCNAGSLHFQLRQPKPQIRSRVGILALQLIAALQFLHSRKLLHRDLKPENVFVNTNGQLKIGDFGLSNVYETLTQDAGGQTICGTAEYFAPELCQRKQYGWAADMWSLGVLLYECMTGKRPFTADTTEGLFKAIIHDKVKPIEDYFDLPETKGNRESLFPNKEYDREIASIIYSLLEKDPKKRPTSTQLLNYPYMRKLRDNFISVLRDQTDCVDNIARIEAELNAQMESAMQELNPMNSSSLMSSVHNSSPSVVTYASSDLGDVDPAHFRGKPIIHQFAGEVIQVHSTGAGRTRELYCDNTFGESGDRDKNVVGCLEPTMTTMDTSSPLLQNQSVYLRLKGAQLIIRTSLNRSSSYRESTLCSNGKFSPTGNTSPANVPVNLENNSFSASSCSSCSSCSSSFSSFECDISNEHILSGDGVIQKSSGGNEKGARDIGGVPSPKNDGCAELEHEKRENSVDEPSKASLAVRRGTQTPSATHLFESHPPLTPVLSVQTKAADNKGAPGSPKFFPSTPPRNNKSSQSFKREHVSSVTSMKGEEIPLEFKNNCRLSSNMNDQPDKNNNSIPDDLRKHNVKQSNSFLCAVVEETTSGFSKNQSSLLMDISSPHEGRKGSLPALSPRWTTNERKAGYSRPVGASKNVDGTANRTLSRQGQASSPTPNQKGYKYNTGSPHRLLPARASPSLRGGKNDSSGGALFNPFPSLQGGTSSSSFVSGASVLYNANSPHHRETKSYTGARVPPLQDSSTLPKHQRSILSPLKTSGMGGSQIIASHRHHSSHYSSPRSRHIGEKILYIPPASEDGNSENSSPCRGRPERGCSRNGLDEGDTTPTHRLSLTPNLSPQIEMNGESRNSSTHLNPVYNEDMDRRLNCGGHRYELSADQCARIIKNTISAKNSSTNISSCYSSPACSPYDVPRRTPDHSETEGSPTMREEDAEVPIRTAVSPSLPVLVYPVGTNTKLCNTEENKHDGVETTNRHSLESQSTISFHQTAAVRETMRGKELQQANDTQLDHSKDDDKNNRDAKDNKKKKHKHHHHHKGKEKRIQETALARSSHSEASEKNLSYASTSYFSLSSVKLLSSSDSFFTLSIKGKEMCFQSQDAKKWSEVLREALESHQSISNYHGSPTSLNGIAPQGSSPNSSFRIHGICDPNLLPNTSLSFVSCLQANPPNPNHYSQVYAYPHRYVLVQNAWQAPIPFQPPCVTNAPYSTNPSPRTNFLGQDVSLGPNEWNSLPPPTAAYPNNQIMLENYAGIPQASFYSRPMDAMVYPNPGTPPTIIPRILTQGHLQQTQNLSNNIHPQYP